MIDFGGCFLQCKLDDYALSRINLLCVYRKHGDLPIVWHITLNVWGESKRDAYSRRFGLWVTDGLSTKDHSRVADNLLARFKARYK